MLGSSAMQQLGKIVNPMTNKTEVSLEGARMSIDMLEMLKAKTAGNLDREESGMLDNLISSLQMTYVETANAGTSQNTAPEAQAEDEKADAATGTTPEAKGETGSETERDSGGTVESAGDSGGHKEPKYHKSYGA
jgi:hypothetical protein